MAAEKLSLKGEELVLAEVKSSGERVTFKDTEVSLVRNRLLAVVIQNRFIFGVQVTGLSVNGRIFIAKAEHIDALTPLAEQEGPKEGTFNILE